MTVSTRTIAGSPAEVSVEAFLVPNAYPTDAQLIDGVIVMTDATFRHQLVALRLVTALHLWCKAGPGRGRAGFGGNWVVNERTRLVPGDALTTPLLDGFSLDVAALFAD